MIRLQDPIKETVDSILKVDSKKTLLLKKQVPRKELFIAIINNIEKVANRSNLAFMDLSLDLSTFEDAYYAIIDGLILMHFGFKCGEIISFYINERTIDEEANGCEYTDANGKTFVLNNAEDLWNYLIFLNPSLLNEEEG
jgi:hypothetical protein